MSARQETAEHAPAPRTAATVPAPHVTAPLAGDLAGSLLGIQRAAGNRAVRALLARQAQTSADAGSAVHDDDELTNIIDEAMDRSRTAYEHILRGANKGYRWIYATDRPTATDHANKLVLVNPTGLTREQILVRVMYESGNIVNEDLFDTVRRNRAAGAYRTGEQYARAVLDAESTTAVYASIKAVEAGVRYSTELDALVRAGTKPGEQGKLEWKSERQRDAVFRRAFELVWRSATAVDEQGQRAPARDVYARQFGPPTAPAAASAP